MGTTRTGRPAGTGSPRPHVARLTRPWLRASAWVVGALTFFGPWAALGFSPKPASSASAATSPQPQREPDRPRRVIHRVIRRVIITRAPAAPSGVNVVYTGGGSSGGSFSGSSGSSGSSGGGVATTGGS